MIGYNQKASPLMEPFEPGTLFTKQTDEYYQPVARLDYSINSSLNSIPFLSPDSMEYDNKSDDCFHFMDANENMLIPSVEKFCEKLHCSENTKIKVVSIFGNTGDGKSHTMNHTFFNGKTVFPISELQKSCTVGVFGAMQSKMGVLCLDTEGLLGTCSNNDQTKRLLMKVLAISDIVIYRTRSERLHRDEYGFLSTASKAFNDYFAEALQSVAGMPDTAPTLGPSVIIFHETHRTRPLINSLRQSAEDQLRKNFEAMGYEIDAFSSLRYVGVQTSDKSPTDYSKLINIVTMEVENNTIRSPRTPSVVFKALEALNLKFSSKMIDAEINPFPEQYFSCPMACESCSRRCQLSMGHSNEEHQCSHPCIYQQQYENKVFLCKKCLSNGKKVIVQEQQQQQTENSWNGLAKYLWNGSVIDCPQCGEIYRARKYWYGNEGPEANAVKTEVVHVWKDSNRTAKANSYSAQVVIDSVSSITETISSISSPPTKALSDWFADFIAPSYWKPNHEIIVCFACKKHFEKTGLRKHHCRSCGEGFCHTCSQHKMPVPSRGWNEPVRVCNHCKGLLSTSSGTDGIPTEEEPDIFVRKYGETVYNTLTTVASAALQYPKEIIKDKARPDYWVPDADSPNCHICKLLFGTAESLALLSHIAGTSHANDKLKGDNHRHHCRRCGQAVCNNCSRKRQPVPERGWPTDVRVCDACANNQTGDSLSPSPSSSAGSGGGPSSSANAKESPKKNVRHSASVNSEQNCHSPLHQKLEHLGFEEMKSKNE